MDSQYSQSQHLQSEYDDQDWYNGSIKCLTLENFMCHSNFHLSLNPQINFISGLNGSGKSAIQTALVVGFGCRASITNRGSSLKSLIKFGCPSASISITIANGEPGLHAVGPYRQEVYGKQITLVRQITQSGGNTYKFLNERGKVVKDSKNELKKIVLHFNILIDNPICVMNQAMVKTFHKSSDPSDKYKLFYQAISADVHRDKIEETNLVATEYSEKLANAKIVLDQCWKEVREYESYEIKSKQIEKLKDELSSFENEYAWLLVAVHEETCNTCLNKIEFHKSNILQGQNTLKVLEEKIKTCAETLKIKKEEVRNIEASRSRNHLILMETKKELQTKTRELELSQQINKKHESALQLLIHDRKDLEKHVETERKKGITNTLAQYKKMLAQYEQNVSEIEAAWKTNVEHEQTLINTVDDLKQKMGSLKNSEITPLQRRIFELNRSINSMSQQEDRTNFYGNWMPSLVKAVDNAFKQNKFTKKPIGPIGAHIKVNDDKWIFAIENHIGRSTLRTFLVDNFNDNKVLQFIMDKTIPGNVRKPTIITSKFFDRVHNISSKETKNSLFRMLSFTSPVVANCLIDNNRIETIMLVGNTSEAMPLMENISTVPKFCNFSLTKDGTQVYPSPSYRVYSLQNPSEPILLQSDVSVAVNNLKHEKDNLDLKITQLTKEFEKVDKLKLDKQQYLNKTQSETRLLKAKYDEYSKKVNEVKAKCDEAEDDRMATLTEEINEVDSRIAEVEQLKKETLEPISKYEVEIKVLNEKLSEMKSTIDKTDRNAMYEETEKLQREIDKLHEQVRQVNNKSDEGNHVLTKLTKDLEAEKKTLKEVTKQAEAMSDRTTSSRSQEDVWRDIEKSNQKIKLLQMELKSKGENYLVLRGDYKRKKEEHLHQLALYRKIEGIYKANCAFVRHNTEALTNYINKISCKVIESFDLILIIRKMKGKLSIENNEQSLVITMFDNISTSCASGGERTFATVALILALWGNMGLPFYSIDEYDVFMDNVNRLATTNLLMTTIEKRKNQFIFLTPQDISHIKSAHNIKIVKLKEPRS